MTDARHVDRYHPAGTPDCGKVALVSAPGRHAWRARRYVRALLAATAVTVVTACGSSSPKAAAVPTLHWYAGSDRIDPIALARTCTDEASGAYRIVVEPLPANIAARHDELVRRMLAHDTSIDLLSLDSAFTAEFAAADFLAPVPGGLAAAQVEIAPAALAAAKHQDKLVAVPWVMNPQVLWFRGNVAERAGLDTSKPIIWDDLIAGAQRLGVTIQIQDPDGSGVADWVNALVASSGGNIVEGIGRDAKVGLNTDAGRSAASIVEYFAESAVGPGPSADALKGFAGPNGGFLLASASAVVDPAVASVASEMIATNYPAVAAKSAAPLRGVALAVPKDAPNHDESYAAIACLTAPEQLRTLVVDAQQSVSKLSTYADPVVRAAFPQAKVAGQALKTGATPPPTPYWFQVVRALDETWRPISEVSQDVTPSKSHQAVESAVKGTLR